MHKLTGSKDYDSNSSNESTIQILSKSYLKYTFNGKLLSLDPAIHDEKLGKVGVIPAGGLYHHNSTVHY